MNKIAIPALLVATVMVAGMFAFAPVEQASTVHTTFGSNIQSTTSTATMEDGAGAVSDTIFSIACTADALIYSIQVNVDANDGTEDFLIDDSDVPISIAEIAFDAMSADIVTTNADLDLIWDKDLTIDLRLFPIFLQNADDIDITIEDTDATAAEVDSDAVWDIMFTSVNQGTTCTVTDDN